MLKIIIISSIIYFHNKLTAAAKGMTVSTNVPEDRKAKTALTTALNKIQKTIEIRGINAIMLTNGKL